MKFGTSKAVRQSGAQGVSPTQANARTSARLVIPSGDGTVSGKTRRNQTNLDVGSKVFGESVIRGLIDEWLAPMIADKLISDLICSEQPNKER